MARPKKYTPDSLAAAVNRYFRSISRMVPLTERVDTGRRDSKGHVVYEEKPVMNRLDEQAQVLEFFVPPTVGGLCEYLKIHRSTWSEWCGDETFKAITDEARGVMQAYLEQQLLTRKDVKGVAFELTANYGYKEKQTVEITGGGVEEYLASLEKKGRGGQEF